MKFLLLTLFVAIHTSVWAAENVPYSATTIKNVGAGFIEIVGPGKVKIGDETHTYENKVYISVDRISSISSVVGAPTACVIHFSSENHTESITLLKLACYDVLKVVYEARQ